MASPVKTNGGKRVYRSQVSHLLNSGSARVIFIHVPEILQRLQRVEAVSLNGPSVEL